MEGEEVLEMLLLSFMGSDSKVSSLGSSPTISVRVSTSFVALVCICKAFLQLRNLGLLLYLKLKDEVGKGNFETLKLQRGVDMSEYMLDDQQALKQFSLKSRNS